MKYIKSIDLIGSPIQFKIHSSENYQTLLGGLLTLIIAGFVLPLTIDMLITLFSRKSPSVNKSSSYMNEAFINLTENYPIMMTIVQRGMVHLDNPDSYYTITALAYNGNYTYNGTNRTANLNLIKMDIHKCSNYTFKKDFGPYSDFFESALTTPDLSKVYCFPINQNNSWLYGLYGQRPLQYLDFSINFCDNSTSKVTCKSMAEINKTLSTVFLIVSYPDFYFDPMKEDPGVFYINTKAFPISSTFYKRYYIDYKLVEYNTDTGLVFTDTQTKYYYQKNSEEKDFNIEVKGVLNTTFSEFTVTMFSKVYDSYTRNYRKAPEYLADIGGVINSLYIIATILNYYVEKRLKEADIFNTCCSDSIESKTEKSPSSSFKKLNLKMNEIQNKTSNIKANNRFDLLGLNSINSNQHIGLPIVESLGDVKVKELSERNKEPNEIIKLNKEKSEDTNLVKIIRFKSIILEKSESLQTLIKIDYDIFDIIFPCRRNNKQNEKMDLAEKFCDQLFDVHFLFGNVLDAQVNFKKIFEKYT